MSDGPNGARGESYVSGITAACFPCSTCVGATFDVDRVYQLGEEIAKETVIKSANVLLAPTMNIIRSPLGELILAVSMLGNAYRGVSRGTKL